MTWAPDFRVRGSAALPGTAPPPELGPGLTRLEVLRRLDTGFRGLSDAEADARLARYGENSPPVPRGPWWLSRVLRALRDPFTTMLLVLGIASSLVASWGTACVITVLVAVSIVLRLAGERRAERASGALWALMATTVTVRRKVGDSGAAQPREIPVEQLVPGDVVRLGAGDVVPADVRLLRATGLTVHQAALTGESVPVRKHPVDVPAPRGAAEAADRAPGAKDTDGGGPCAVAAAEGEDLFNRSYLCFQGSSVASGSALAVVVATGAATCFARGQSRQGTARRPPATAFERSVDGISWILIRFMLLTPPLVLMANAALRGRGLETLPFAVAVAVGLTPEMLPVIVTTSLSRGAAALARTRDVIVRRLPALHDVGAMDILCVDKTGTLTQDRPVVEGAFDAAGRPDADVLDWAARNSWWTLHLAELPEPDPLDEAVLEATDPDDGFEGVAVLPFDPARRLATAVLCSPGDWARHTLVVKGAIAEVLDRCDQVRATPAHGTGPRGPESDGPDRIPLDAAARREILHRAAGYADEGLRVLAVAVARRRARADAYRPDDERDLTFLGFVTFRDAVSDTAADAVAALAESGVAVKVLTGDQPGTAARVCRAVGLDPGDVVEGPRVSALNDTELGALAERTTVFARCTPEQKARVVGVLRTSGHTTGFLGDGVNDLPAMQAADVGICPRGAVDVVRESADVVLAHKDLTAIDHAVTEGRRSSGNIASYLRITVSSNLGNVIAMLVAGLMMPFLPMLPVQVLVQNLLFDVAQLALAFDRPPDAVLRRPLTLRPDHFLRFVTRYGALNAAADLATFAVLLWATDGQAPFQTGWFTENLLTQALVIIVLRKGRGVGRAPALLVLAACGLVVIGIAMPVSPVATALGMTALPARYWLGLCAVLALFTVVLTTQQLRDRDERTHKPG